MAAVNESSDKETNKVLAAMFARMYIETGEADEKTILRTLKLSQKEYVKYIKDVEDVGIYEVN